MCTYLNGPNCAPTLAQPFGAVASLMICLKSICFFGQPSACAIGFHIAITSGVRTIDGLSVATSPESLWRFTSRPQNEDEGDQIVGFSCPFTICF